MFVSRKTWSLFLYENLLHFLGKTCFQHLDSFSRFHKPYQSTATSASSVGENLLVFSSPFGTLPPLTDHQGCKFCGGVLVLVVRRSSRALTQTSTSSFAGRAAFGQWSRDREVGWCVSTALKKSLLGGRCKPDVCINHHIYLSHGLLESWLTAAVLGES